MIPFLREIKRIPAVSWIWKRIRLQRILKQHHIVAAICDAEINKYVKGDSCKYQYYPKQNLGTEKIIWQYWDSLGDNVPEIVQICLDSVERYSGDYLLIRLSANNWRQYVELPDFLFKDGMSQAHFTDVLRLALLVAYGGVWLDATVFLTGLLPEDYSKLQYFMFQRDPDEEHKEYWENTWSYYFGWDKNFKVRVLNSVIFSRRGNESLMVLSDILINYWREHDSLPDYLFFQILFNQAVENHIIECIPITSDCVPHYLQQLINTGVFYFPLEKIFSSTTIHKLSCKIGNAADRLKAHLPIKNVQIDNPSFDAMQNQE